MLWLAGEHDTKYADLVGEIKELSPNMRAKVIEGAGHRLPWGSKDLFVDELMSFLSS